MIARLAARLVVDAIRRLAEAAGGQATVLARGDADAGAILVVTRDRDGRERAHEREPAFTGGRWQAVGPDAAAALADYLARRRRGDPDLWVLELSGLDDPAAVFADVATG